MSVRALWISAVAVLLIGCGSGGSGGGFSSRKVAGSSSVFRYPMAISPTTLDPTKVQDIDTLDLLGNIYEPLLNYDENNKLIGILAESWSLSEDAKTYTFKLKNAKFHNGTAVSAKDVKASWERALYPAMASPTAETYLSDIVGAKDLIAGKTSELSGLKVVDDFTLQVTIDEPKPYFLGKLTYACCAVVPASSPKDEIGAKETAIGTGPFKLSDFKPEQLVVLKKNPDYHGGTPSIEEVQRKVVKDSATRLNMFRIGESDMLTLEKQDWSGVKNDPQLKDQLKFIDRPAIYYLLLSAKAYEPFNDVHVRRAIAMAIDRDKITSKILAGVPKATRWLPKGIVDGEPSVQTPGYDPAAAKAELALSSFKDGSKLPPLELTIRAENADARYISEQIANDLKNNLGMKVQPRSIDWGTLLKKRNKGELQSAFLSWFGDYIDPQNFLSMLMRSDAAANFDKWSNREFDTLCRTADVEKDAEQRKKLYLQAEDIVLREMPRVPLYHGVDGVLISPRVKGLRYNLLGTMPHQKVSLAP
jgi:oligopeptide transport system substrate-binding protein